MQLSQPIPVRPVYLHHIMQAQPLRHDGPYIQMPPVNQFKVMANHQENVGSPVYRENQFKVEQPKQEIAPTPQFRIGEKIAYKPVKSAGVTKQSITTTSTPFVAQNIKEDVGRDAFVQDSGATAPAAFKVENWNVFGVNNKTKEKSTLTGSNLPTNFTQSIDVLAATDDDDWKGTVEPLPEFPQLNPTEAVRLLRSHLVVINRHNQRLLKINERNSIEMDRLVTEVQDLSEKATHSSQLLDSVTSQNCTLGRKLNDSTRELKELHLKKIEEDEKSNREFEQLKDDHKYLKASLNQAEAALQQIQDNLLRDEDNKEKLYAARGAEIKSLLTAISDKDTEIQKSYEIVKTLEWENKVMKSRTDGSAINFDSYFGEIESDVKEKLARQKATILADASVTFESQESEIERLKFELEKKDRAVSALQTELSSKAEELYKATHDLEYLQAWQENASVVDKSRTMTNQFTRATAELETKRAEKNALEIQVSKLEGNLQQKDGEIQSFRYQIHDVEQQLLHTKREVNQLKFDLDIKDSQIVEIENSITRRETEAGFRLSQESEYREKLLQQQKDTYQITLNGKLDLINDLEQNLQQAHSEKEAIKERFLEVVDTLEKKENEIRSLKEALLEVEGNLYSQDKTHELDILKRANRELTGVIRDNAEKLSQRQEDSLLLHQSVQRNESLMLENLHLKDSLAKQHTRISGDKQGKISYQRESESVCTPVHMAGNAYIPVKGDRVDAAVAICLNSQAFPTCMITRLEANAYLIDGVRRELTLDDRIVNVNVNGHWVPLETLLDVRE